MSPKLYETLQSDLDTCHKIFGKEFCSRLAQPYSTWGMGGQISACLQIFFFTTSVRDTNEPPKFAHFSKNVKENTILNVKMTNSYPEPRHMTIFGKGLCHKVIKLHLYCHNV